MNQLEFSLTKSPEINDLEFLWNKLREHGLEKLSNPSLDDAFQFAIYAKDKEEIVGGLIGEVYYKGMHIRLLWVSENYRKAGIGSSLMNKAEELARESNCTLVYLNTFSFQAPKFYEKQGFEIFGKIENFPGTHTRIFLVKRLK